MIKLLKLRVSMPICVNWRVGMYQAKQADKLWVGLILDCQLL